MFSKEQAIALIYSRINQPNPQWPDKPEMVVVLVEERELGWLVYYDSGRHQETKDVRDALAGNAPFLVSKEDGTVFETYTAMLDESLRKAEKALELHKAKKTNATGYPLYSSR